MKLSTLTALALLLASPAFAQSVPLQSGPVTPGHAPMYVNTGSGQPIVTDGGGAANGAIGKNLSELGITARSPNNAYPVANGGKGALNSHFCMYDAPSTNATGYHFLCMEPNAQGGGVVSYGASGTAAPLPLYFDINGVTTVAGGGTPGGSSGQAQFNNAGSFGGFTVGGDATLNTSTGALTVTKTGGVAFGALATQATVNLATQVTGLGTGLAALLGQPPNAAGGLVGYGGAMGSATGHASLDLPLTGGTLTGTLGITPASSAFPLAMNISQTVTGTATSPQYYENLINILDTVDSSSTANGGNFGLFVQQAFGGTGTKGNKIAIYGTVTNTGGATTNAAGNYVGVQAYSNAVNADGGTGTTVGTAAGSFFGVNPGVTASASATNLLLLAGGEVDVTAFSGSSMANKVGLQIVQTAGDAVRGTQIDAALRITNQPSTSGWLNGILFDDQYTAALATTGCLICSSGSWTAATGLDFSSLTLTTFLKGPNSFSVDGSANVAANALSLKSPLSAWAQNFGGTATSVTTSGLALAAGRGLIEVDDNTDNASALYMCAAGACSEVFGVGTIWVASTTTPASGKMSVSYNGSAYQIYNNTGGTKVVSADLISTHAGP